MIERYFLQYFPNPFIIFLDIVAMPSIFFKFSKLQLYNQILQKYTQ